MAGSNEEPRGVRLPATGPFVDRIVRIFRDRPHDDTSAVVLLDYAREAIAALARQEEGREAVDYTDIANRAQEITGRSIFPSTVEAVLKVAGHPAPPPCRSRLCWRWWGGCARLAHSRSAIGPTNWNP